MDAAHDTVIAALRAELSDDTSKPFSQNTKAPDRDVYPGKGASSRGTTLHLLLFMPITKAVVLPTRFSRRLPGEKDRFLPDSHRPPAL